MRKLLIKATLFVATLAALGLGSYAMAGGDESEFRARLSGYQETPQTLSSPGFGRSDSTSINART